MAATPRALRDRILRGDWWGGQEVAMQEPIGYLDIHQFLVG
jgi:hypothetical protein